MMVGLNRRIKKSYRKGVDGNKTDFKTINPVISICYQISKISNHISGILGNANKKTC